MDRCPRSTGPGYAGPMPTDAETIRRVLAKWDGFPIAREPRPIVLAKLTPNAKKQELSRLDWRSYFDEPAAAAAAPPQITGTLREFFGGIRVVPPESWGPLVRGLGAFGTDRGVRDLPAWWMRHPETRGPWYGLDAQFLRAQTWRPPGLDQRGGPTEASRLAADGRTLTYRFLGDPASEVEYTHGEVYETETAVVVLPVGARLNGPLSSSLLIDVEREVTVPLSAPLGNRVLIDVDLGGGGEDAFNGLPRIVLPQEQQ